MNDNQREAEVAVDLCTKCGLPDKARAEWGGSWVSHEPAYGHAFQSGSPRRFIFEYEPARDEWSARETEHDEIVVARGFDDGFRVLAGWVLEHEAFARFGHNEKWERVEYEGDTLLVYGPAERLSTERILPPHTRVEWRALTPPERQSEREARAEADPPAVEHGHYAYPGAPQPSVVADVEEARRVLLDHTAWHAWDCDVERRDYRIVGGTCTCSFGKQVAAFERAVVAAYKDRA